jgi:hypothetical protein
VDEEELNVEVEPLRVVEVDVDEVVDDGVNAT